MERNFLSFISIILILLLCYSVTASLSKNLVAAYNGYAVFCPDNYVPGLDTPAEITLSDDTSWYIADLLANYRTHYCYLETGPVYGTKAEYLNCLNTLDTYFEQKTVFSKGHDPPWGPDLDHYYLVDYYGAHIKDSEDIWYYTNNDYDYIFLWHCATANSYPSHYDYDIGWAGHCMCWTHNNGLPLYNWSGDDVFLGWYYRGEDDRSPQFSDQANDDFNYAHVAYLFWEGVTVYGYDVCEALNYAARTVWGQDQTFWDTPLYTGDYPYEQLRVYGDMGMYLP